MPLTHLGSWMESFLFSHNHWFPISAAFESYLTASWWSLPHTLICQNSLDVDVAMNLLQLLLQPAEPLLSSLALRTSASCTCRPPPLHPPYELNDVDELKWGRHTIVGLTWVVWSEVGCHNLSCEAEPLVQVCHQLPANIDSGNDLLI